MSYLIWGAVVFITLQRFLELRLAKRNRTWALEAGAQEFGANHYPLFFLLHTGWMIGWVVEAFARGPALSRFWYVWLLFFIIAQGLRYWAIRSLGRCWNTRILVIPGAVKVERGLYRFIRHPNYLAVGLELASVPLIFGAWLTALVASILNAGILLFVRIPAEEQARQLMEKQVIFQNLKRAKEYPYETN